MGEELKPTGVSQQLAAGRKRALALDALRGLAILGMALSAYIPYGVLPAWMYHAQVPPPAHTFDPSIPGLTWVDLVFPFFLFSMGAAMPLALSRRIEKGLPHWKTVTYILERGFLLAAFAIYREHILPRSMSEHPTTAIYLLALFAFALLFPILVRFPESWNPRIRTAIKACGWLGAVVFMALMRYPDGSRFSLYRSDIIILLLANSAVFGSLIWLVSRTSLPVRLGFLGILMAIRLSAPVAGWVNAVSEYSPIPWVYRLGYLYYLFIVIPGTIVGDLILKWMQSPARDPCDSEPFACHSERSEESRFSHAQGKLREESQRWRAAFIVVLMVALNIVAVVPMHRERWLLSTTLGLFALCALGVWLLSRPTNATEKLIKGLFLWGIYWLALGLVFEPYEGGIKKDPNTMSYFFINSGLAIFLLIGFTAIIDIFGKARWVQLLIDNGQNPMIAYVAITNLVPPVLAITMLEGLLRSITPTPWLGALRGVFMTFLLALSVSFFTKRKIFWRT